MQVEQELSQELKWIIAEAFKVNSTITAVDLYK